MIAKYYLAMICGISIVLMSFIVTSAQTPKTSKVFECDNTVPSLDAFRYNDGRELSYDIIGCPIERIVIHEWNNVNTIDKASINTVLISKGLIEKEEFNTDTGEIIDTTKLNTTSMESLTS